MAKEKKDFYDCSIIIQDSNNNDVDICLKFQVDSFTDAIDKLKAFPVKGNVTNFIFGDFHTIKKQ